MWQRVKDLWEHNRLALIAFVVVVCLAGFFGVKSTMQLVYWSDPQHQDQDLAGWMTPRYVARSYDVPPEVVIAAFDLATDAPPRRVSLETLAAQEGVTLDVLQARLDTAIAAWRATNPRPTP